MRIDAGNKPFIPEMRLFHSRKKLLRWARKRGKELDLLDADAQTCMVDGIGVVLLELKADYGKWDVWDDMLLVHEAVHVVSNNLEAMCEDDVGEETFAYMVQIVAGLLIEANSVWMAEHANDDVWMVTRDASDDEGQLGGLRGRDNPSSHGRLGGGRRDGRGLR